MRRRIVLVAGAVLLALVGTVTVYSYAQGANQRALAGTRAAHTLVVTKRVPAGTTWAAVVKGHYASLRSLPASSVPSDAIDDTATAAIGSDAVAQADIAPGQVLLRESFGTATSQTGALAIPRGKIAISLALTSDADVAGYVASQSQVVVFHTFTLTGTKADATTTQGQGLTVTKTLIPRAVVLATSQAAPTTVSGTATQDASTSTGSVLLTLALSQQDAQRLVLAQKTGSLYLGLLSASSTISGTDPGVENVGDLSPVHVYGQ